MYVRKVDDQVLTLRVSGKLWMRSLVMSDVETDTEWAHLLGRAMKGRLKGKTLKPLITDMVTWKVWRQENPDTTVMKLSATSKNYTREFYRDPSRFVFGFEVGGDAYALPMAGLIENNVHVFDVDDTKLVATFDPKGAVTHLFETDVDGQTLEFESSGDGKMTDRQTKSVWKTSSGEALEGPLKGKLLRQRVGIMSFTAAWKNFHPDSQSVKF